LLALVFRNLLIMHKYLDHAPNGTMIVLPRWKWISSVEGDKRADKSPEDTIRSEDQSLHTRSLHSIHCLSTHTLKALALTHTLNRKHPIKGKTIQCDVEEGFAAQASLTGELVGHVALGTLIVSTTLVEILQADKALLAGRSFEEVRAHILHVILAHHGTNEHGSPVEPQTLEALIVHSVDRLDAHAEIMRAAWLAADSNASLIDAPRPLKGKLARSLQRTSAPITSASVK
jgi:hypothetical protein